jgi:SAM-dependent methyltransferase
MDSETIKAAVRGRYALVVTHNEPCCGEASSCGCGKEDPSLLLGYETQDLEAVPEGANLGLGCGNPVALASLQPGETVLDLGSGAGFDAFLASTRVGPEGRVIGVDMTPEMIARARDNAEKLGYDNVEFRLGEIESMPVADAEVDLVISNCVLNLVPDKARAFAEIARVLKPGGRLVVSDIVRVGELPAAMRDNLAAYAACASGAWPREEYLAGLAAAGLEQVEVVREVEARALLTSAACCGDGMEDLTDGVLASVTVRARKPRP